MQPVIKAYVSRSAIAGNVGLLMNRSGGVPLCAMVKANAYGHGMDIVARALSGQGVAFWGVANFEESIALRAMGVSEPVLALQPVGAYVADSDLRELLELARKHGIRVTVADMSGLGLLRKYVCGNEDVRKIYVHIKVDTGMGRSGCSIEEAESLVLKATSMPDIVVEGVYSHFACADEPDLLFARKQIDSFKSVTDNIESNGVSIPIKHISNSAAIFNLPESHLDMVRPGLSLYGYGGEYIKGCDKLVPALKLVAPVVLIKRIKKGRPCGYGASFIAKRDTRTGLLPIGYADGYFRRLSNLGRVDIAGRLVPVIGRVSMDFTIIDLTDVPEAGVGTQVCVISDDREAPHSVESIAKQLKTIPQDVTVRLGSRIQRVMAD